MNTKSNKTKKKFQDLLGFSTDAELIEHRSKMIMFSFLHFVELEMEKRNMTKKDLAKELKTSASFVTKLFTGTKTINLLTIAKLEEIFDINFHVALKPKSIDKLSRLKKTNRSKKVITA